MGAPTPAPQTVNPFDAADPHPVQVNPFDAADPHPVQANPVSHYTLPQVPGAMYQNFGPSASRFLGSMEQAVTHPRQTAEGIGNLAGGTALNALFAAGNATPLKQAMPEIRAAVIAQNPALMNHMINTANAVGGQYQARYGGKTLGEAYNNIKRTMAEDPVGFAADAASLLDGAGGVLKDVSTAGGIAEKAGTAIQKMGSVVNPINAPAYAATTIVREAPRLVGKAPIAGMNVGAPMRFAGNVVRKAVDASPILGGINRLILNATAGKEQDVLNALRSPTQIVNGSAPTAAQAVASAVTAPKFAAIGKGAAGRLPDEFTAIEEAQNAARIAAIQNVTPHADLPAADAARDAQAVTDYSISNPVYSSGDPRLLNLKNRPSLREAFDRAKTGAAEKGLSFGIGNDAPAQTIPASTVASSVLDANGRPVLTTIPEQNIPAQFASYSGEELQRVIESLNQMAFNKDKFGIGAHEASDVRGSRQALIDWIGQPSKNPAWTTARQNFAAASTPIDQTKLLNYYINKLQSPLMGDDIATQRADAFAAARSNGLNEALGNSNIKRATGQQRVAHERNLLAPQQIQALDNVQADLARAKLAESHAKAGSQYQSALGSPKTGAPGVPSATGIPSQAINALSEFFTHGERDAVAKAVLTPDDAATLLSNALARRDWINRSSNSIKRTGSAVQNSYLNRYPASYNALQMERDTQSRKNTK